MATIKTKIIIIAIGGLFATTLQAGPKAKIAQTGQVDCYDVFGNPVVCAGTGQDGDIRAGSEPPAPRFTDHGNGTIRDDLTKLTWLKNANCLATPGLGPFDDIDDTANDGRVFWQTALDFANTLASGQCDLMDGSLVGDWRLPNVRELHTLIDYGQLEPALPAGHPFSNLDEQGVYYSSTSDENARFRAWIVSFFDGVVIYRFKTFEDHNVIAVKGGSVPD